MASKEEVKRAESRLATVNRAIPELEAQVTQLRGEAQTIWDELFPRLLTAYLDEVKRKRDQIDEKNREASRIEGRLRKLRTERSQLLSLLGKEDVAA